MPDKLRHPVEAAFEVISPQIKSKDPTQALIAAKCMGLMMGYDKRWRDAPYLIDDVEAVLTSDLYNPETQRKSRSFALAGRLDVRCRETATGRRILFDHKSCSEEIQDPNSPYWRQLVVEGQVSHYMTLEWLNGNKVDAAVWDVMRKPGIAPKKLSKTEAQNFLSFGLYFGNQFDKAEMDKFNADEEKRETMSMYAARLVSDCSQERPEWYFQRRTVPRMEGEIREYMEETWGHSKDILACRATNRWPRNGGACMLYKSPCMFLPVCSGYDSIDSGRWTKREWVHPELPVLQGSDRGTDILTNSRIRCFQTCRRKHYFLYEIGVERMDEEERESLQFGNLWHAGLEAYFVTLKQIQQKGT